MSRHESWATARCPLSCRESPNANGYFFHQKKSLASLGSKFRSDVNLWSNFLGGNISKTASSNHYFPPSLDRQTQTRTRTRRLVVVGYCHQTKIVFGPLVSLLGTGRGGTGAGGESDLKFKAYEVQFMNTFATCLIC